MQQETEVMLLISDTSLQPCQKLSPPLALTGAP